MIVERIINIITDWKLLGKMDKDITDIKIMKM